MRFYSFALLAINLIMLLFEGFMMAGFALWPEEAGGFLYRYLAINLLFLMCASMSTYYVFSFLRDKISNLGYFVYLVLFLNAGVLIGALFLALYDGVHARYSLEESIGWSLLWVVYPILNIIHGAIVTWKKFRVNADVKQHSFWANFDKSN